MQPSILDILVLTVGTVAAIVVGVCLLSLIDKYITDRQSKPESIEDKAKTLEEENKRLKAELNAMKKGVPPEIAKTINEIGK